MTQDDLIKLLAATTILMIRIERDCSSQADADIVRDMLVAAGYDAKVVMQGVCVALEAEDDSDAEDNGEDGNK